MATCTSSLQPEPWQAGIRTMKEGFSHYFTTGVLSDITFIVSNREFKCHKLILGARSPVFEEMLLSCEESMRTNRITISNVSQKGFEILIRYIYTNDLGSNDGNRLDKSDILEAYQAAQRYRQSGLEKRCEEYIAQWEITKENVCDVLNKVFDIPSQRQRCCYFLQNNAEDVLASTSFLTTSPFVLHHIFEAGCFSHVAPMTLLNHVVHWGSNQFAATEGKKDYRLVREVLLHSEYQLLGKLKIEKMNEKQLAQVIEDYPNLLKSEEESLFFLNIHKPGLRPLPEWCKK